MDSPFRRLISLLFEAAIIFAVSAWLIRQAASWIYEVRWVLIIVASFAVAVTIAHRVYKHLKGWEGSDDFL